MRKRKLYGVNEFEQLELRRLLAADFCMQAMPESVNPEAIPCEVATFDCTVNEVTTDPVGEPQEVDVVDDDVSSTTMTPQILDLSDGMDGYFGVINSDNPAETLEFTAPAGGNVDIVVSSSLGEGHVTLTVANAEGEQVQGTFEQLDGFGKYTFEVAQDETWQMSVSSDDASCEGHFQLTIAFAEHVDQHADQVGTESTVMELSENSAGLSGRLESSGDVDTFRFTATTSGEATIDLNETVDGSRIGLNVVVEDSKGNMLVEGRTNEMLQASFDVEEGQEYFVSIGAGQEQVGTYQFGLELTPDIQTPATDVVDSEVAEDSLDCEVTEPETIDSEVVGSEVADPEPGDMEVVETGDEIANPETTEESSLPVGNELPGDDRVAEDECVDADSGTGSETDLAEQLADPVEEQPANESFDDSDLSNVGTDCLEDESVVASDDSDIDQSGNPDMLDEEIIEGELIASPVDDVIDNDLNSDESVDCFGDMATVDRVFIGLGSDFDWQIEFSFGDHWNNLVLSSV